MMQLKAALFEDLAGTLSGLQSALQNAIELEHSTIPPYLYALYSIRQDTNVEIAMLIKSIVVEEMLRIAIDWAPEGRIDCCTSAESGTITTFNLSFFRNGERFDH
jgi:hypothetical protein